MSATVHMHGCLARRQHAVSLYQITCSHFRQCIMAGNPLLCLSSYAAPPTLVAAAFADRGLPSFHAEAPAPRRQSGIAGLKRLRELSIETQRLSFHCPFGPAAAVGQGTAAPADPSPPPRLRLAAQELAVYGGAAPVTSGLSYGSWASGLGCADKGCE